jgi:hypothetical protein
MRFRQDKDRKEIEINNVFEFSYLPMLLLSTYTNTMANNRTEHDTAAILLSVSMCDRMLLSI